MKRTFRVLLVVGTLWTAVVTGGCQTYGESAGLGALVGAAAGAIIGHQSGHGGEGALIGAALGGLSGVVVHDAIATKSKDPQTTAAEYRYRPSQGEMMTFEDAAVSPSVVRRGSMAESSMQYALLGTGAGTRVTETRILKRGEAVVAQLSSKTYTRNDGTWVSTQQFRISERLAPGEYTLVQTAQTAQSMISGSAAFIVN